MQRVPISRKHKFILISLLLLLGIILLIYFKFMLPPAKGRVVVFIVDTEVDFKFVDNLPSEISQDFSHGSIVTRIIREEAPEAILKSCVVEDRDQQLTEESYLAGLMEILQYKKNHAKDRVLVNISLAFSEDNPIHRQLIKELFTAGVMLVAAAGNDNSPKPIYPAGYSEAVVAVANASEDGKDPSSNYGSYIDLSASGTVEYIARQYLLGNFLTRTYQGEGTSFAAPRVVGLLAKLLILKPGMSPKEALQLILENTEPIQDPHYFYHELGKGAINPTRVIASVDPFLDLRQAFLRYALIISLLTIGIVALYCPERLILIFLLSFIGIPFAFLMGDRLVCLYHLLQRIGVSSLHLVVWVGILFTVYALTKWEKRLVFLWFVGITSIILILSMYNSWDGEVLIFLWIFAWILVGIERFKVRQVSHVHENLNLLLTYYCSFSLRVSSVAKEYLIKLNDSKIEEIIWTLDNVKSKRKIFKLLHLLGELDCPEGRDSLIYHLYHPSLQIKQEAFKILLWKEDISVDLLLSFVVQNNIFSKLVVHRLIKMGEKIIPELVEILKSSDLAKKRLVSEILGSFNSPKVLEELKKVLDSSVNIDKQILLEVIEGFGKMASQLSSEVMGILLNDQEMWVRFQALRTIVAIHPEPKNLEELLKSLAEDHQELVRLEARGILKDMKSKLVS